MIAASLICSASYAEDVKSWGLYEDRSLIRLAYGQPDSDNVDLMIECKPNEEGIKLSYITNLPNAVEGWHTDIVLANDGIEFPISAIGAHFDDGSYVLEGTFRMVPDVKRLFRELGGFTIRLEGQENRKYSFDGVRKSASRFVRICK